MKIICTDNFNRETVSDQLVAENVSKFYAKDIVEALNKKYSGHSSPMFFKSVKDDYELFKIEY